MKWFKHDSDAKNDVRCKLLISKYGMEGYGIYWGILEFIADNTIDEKKNADTWGVLPEIFSVDFFAAEFKIDSEKMHEILNYMSQIGLIDQENWSKNKVANFKILTRADEYTEKLKKKIEGTPDNVSTKSGQNPDKVPTKSRVSRRAKILSPPSTPSLLVQDLEQSQSQKRTESEQKTDTNDTTEKSESGKFDCPSSEIAEWVNAHDGFFKISPECIKALLEEFTASQIVDGLKRCNSWIGTGSKQVTNINMTLNKFMDDCRHSRDKPSPDINQARGICTDPSQLQGGFVKI